MIVSSTRRPSWFWLLLFPALYLVHLVLIKVYSTPYETTYIPPPAKIHEQEKHNALFVEPETIIQKETITVEVEKPAPTEQAAYAHFAAPEKERINDVIDSFATYKGAEECGIDSRNLHLPFAPLCQTKQSILTAMSSGGRAGFDKPFIPSGCSMRWYSTQEVCEIISRFEHIFIIGDSLQRHVTNALYTILRSDIELGGITEWDPPIDGEKYRSKDDCKCEKQIITKDCSEKQINDKSWIAGNNSVSPTCPEIANTEITYHRWLQWPLPAEDLNSLSDPLPKIQPAKPWAFIIHHEMWNNVNVTETTWLLDQICDHLKTNFPWLHTYSNFFRLYLTANAGGLAKGMGFLATQGNHKLAQFEREMEPRVSAIGLDYLGMFNMSVQSTQWDGVHTTLEQNLLKVQMIMNWLDKVNVHEYRIV